jgi:hypothetical protein
VSKFYCWFWTRPGLFGIHEWFYIYVWNWREFLYTVGHTYRIGRLSLHVRKSRRIGWHLGWRWIRKGTP